jgi:hypothetical protein
MLTTSEMAAAPTQKVPTLIECDVKLTALVKRLKRTMPQSEARELLEIEIDLWLEARYEATP